MEGNNESHYSTGIIFHIGSISSARIFVLCPEVKSHLIIVGENTVAASYAAVSLLELAG